MPGNHEYDGLDFDQAHEGLRAACDRLGIIWLEREQLLLDGVRFLGTTLWADYDALAQGLDLTRALQQRGKAFRAANFYLEKMGTRRGGALFDAAAMREQAERVGRWCESLGTFRPPGVVDEVALYEGNLISGAIRGDEPAWYSV